MALLELSSYWPCSDGYKPLAVTWPGIDHDFAGEVLSSLMQNDRRILRLHLVLVFSHDEVVLRTIVLGVATDICMVTFLGKI